MTAMTSETVIRLRPRLHPLERDSARGGCTPTMPEGMRHVGAFSLGRDALWWLAQRLRAQGAETVWLPEYCCPQVVDVFRATGWAMHAYPLTENLTVAWERLIEGANGTPQDLLILVDLFGYPCSPPAEMKPTVQSSFRWILRDIAQGLPEAEMEPTTGQRGGWVLFSLRKPLPMPDGAWLWETAEGSTATSDAGIGAWESPPQSHPPTVRRSLYVHWEAWCLRKPTLFRLPGARVTRQLLKASSVRGQRPSALSIRLAAGIDMAAAGQRRRQHAKRLTERLHDVAARQAVPKAAAPYYFPLLVHAAKASQERLARRGIETSRLWGLDGLWPPHPSEAAERSVARLLCVPVHQDLTEEDVKRVGDASCRVLE